MFTAFEVCPKWTEKNFSFLVSWLAAFLFFYVRSANKYEKKDLCHRLLLTLTENLTFLPHRPLNTAEDPDILYTLERNPNRIQILNRIYKLRLPLLLTFG